VNDAKHMYHFLSRTWTPSLLTYFLPDCRQFSEEHGYHKHNIIYLVDTASDARQRPTRANITAAMKWLVKDAKPDDALFIHCTCACV
jgi:hypothetical protein